MCSKPETQNKFAGCCRTAVRNTLTEHSGNDVAVAFAVLALDDHVAIRAGLEVRTGLVPVPGFKPGGAALAGAHGGFDSHALPPL